jgi:hypothetical protein
MEKLETAKDIQTGDWVQLENGEWVTVTRVFPGTHPGDTMLIDWEGKAGAGRAVSFSTSKCPCGGRRARNDVRIRSRQYLRPDLDGSA